MAAYEQKTGGDVLAIAHNGNLSNGRMFPMVEAFGKPVDREYAEDAREVGAALRGDADQGQRRGASLPLAQRRVRRLRALGQGQPRRQRGQDEGHAPVRVRPLGAQERPAARSSKLGANPYKFGLIGSSDAHTGLAAMEEDNFFGKTAPQEPSPERLTKTFIDDPKTGVKIMDWEVGASGYAAVWATENTREAIFDAMQRRETYATTGPRMVVRFFGGWDFEAKRRARPHAGERRLRQGRADGRRPAAGAGGQGADVPRRAR